MTITQKQVRDFIDHLVEKENTYVKDEGEGCFTIDGCVNVAAALEAAQAQDAAELDDATIVRLVREHFTEKAARLTYEKSPGMFPQATYSVPTFALSQFVKAVRAAAPAKQEGA